MTTKNILRTFGLVLLVAALALGQSSTSSNWTTTTLSTAISVTPGSALDITQVLVGTACSNVPFFTVGYAQGGQGQPTSAQANFLYVDRELMRVSGSTASPTTSSCLVPVQRGVQGTRRQAHVSGATVWIGPASWFLSPPGAVSTLVGACPSAGLSHYPMINVVDGSFVSCDGIGNYAVATDSYFYVPPGNCTFVPTTLTQTSTYTYVGASNFFVLNSTTNGATGTDTLTCNIQLPTVRSFGGKAASIWDITALLGSQTLAPSAVGTVTLGSVTYPAAATSETASTVTPVQLGGTVTTVSPTAITSVTTAGAFLSIKTTFASAASVNTDRQILQYTLPLTNGSVSVMTVNTPGLIVHYTPPPVY
jgi:hypothetical protein